MTEENSNRKRLKILMAEHDLKNSDVADILNRSIWAVNAWTAEATDQDIPDHSLELLELKIKNQG